MGEYLYTRLVYWSSLDNCWQVVVPELPGCMAEGKTAASAMGNAEAAIFEWIREAEARGDQAPIPEAHTSYRKDPIEYTSKYLKVVKEVDEKAMAVINEIRQRFYEETGDDFVFSVPFSHRLYHEKKRILKEEYGMDWKSPVEMNPEVVID